MTKRFSGIVLTVLLLLFTVFSANIHAQNSIFSIGAGVSKAIGEGSEDMNLGFNGAATGLFRVSDAVYIGAKIAYNYFSVDLSGIPSSYSGIDISASISILELMPVFRIFPAYGSGFFIQCGAGLYHITASASATYQGQSASDSHSQSEGGVNFAMGFITSGSGSARFEIAPSFHLIFTEGESTKYVAVNFSLAFGSSG